ncbi:sugar phosphate isomerase/epimerase family protein [Erysipelotrichaceae bacterium 66-17]
MEKCIITDQVDDDLECALKQIRDKGIHCVELHNVHGKSIEACSDEEIEQIKRLLDAYGMKVSSIASTIFFLCPLYESDQVSLFNPAFYTIEGDADAHLAYAGRACRIAKKLGASVVRSFPFRAPDNRKGPFGTPADYEKIVANMRRLAQVGEQEGVVFAVENCPYSHLPKGEMTLKLIKEVDSPYIRLLWDPANSYRAEKKQVPDQYKTWSLLDEARELLPYIHHVHLKNYVYDETCEKPFVHVPFLDGDIDFVPILEYLKDHGYTGAVSLEPEVDHEDALRCIDELNALNDLS